MIIRNDRRSGVLAAIVLAAALLAALAILVVVAPGVARAEALVTSVDLGTQDSCVVKTDGKLVCWGKDAGGQVSATPKDTTFSAVSAGGQHSCGIKTDGKVACWGYDSSGQVSAAPQDTTFSTVSAGGAYFTCAIRTGGALACWGENEFRQFDGLPTSGTFTDVSAGYLHSCAIRTGGALACWGSNLSGQLVNVPSGTFSEVSAGGYHSCGIKTDGTLACWGKDASGQVSEAPASGTFTDVSSGFLHSCGIKTDGKVVCWGSDSSGQVSKAPTSDTFSEISAGGYHNCGIKTDGTLACWGDNEFRQLAAAPAVPNPAPPKGQVGTAYRHTFYSSGSPAGSFVVSAGQLPPGLSLSSAGALSGTPTAVGDYTFTVTASNGLFADASQQLTLAVSMATDDAYSTDEDTALVLDAPGVLSNDTHAANAALTAFATGGPSHGTLTFNSDGSFTYTPDKDYNGVDSFTYLASDGKGTEDTATVSIKVNPVNDAPVAAYDSATTDEDTPVTIPVLSNDSDVDGDSLALGIFTGATHGTVSDNGDGTFEYTPDPDYNGPDSFAYKARDGATQSYAAAVFIDVRAVNDAPSFTRGADQSVAEDSGAQSVSGWATGISAGAFETQNVTFGATNDNNTLFTAAGQPKVSLDGTLIYTPAKDANGSATVTVEANDDGGTANGGVDTSAAQTFTITVTPVNDAPTISVVAGSSSQSACLSNTSGRITLKLSDAESNLGDLKPSVASSSNTRLVPNGNVAFGGSGGTRTATISTVPGRTGSSTVTITVSDGQASGTVPVTVKAGGSGRNTLGGTRGADLLLGQKGDDTLGGAASNDVLCGANGNDRLTGGAGADTFDGGPETDTATDFNTGEGDSRTNIP